MSFIEKDVWGRSYKSDEELDDSEEAQSRADTPPH